MVNFSSNSSRAFLKEIYPKNPCQCHGDKVKGITVNYTLIFQMFIVIIYIFLELLP